MASENCSASKRYFALFTDLKIDLASDVAGVEGLSYYICGDGPHRFFFSLQGHRVILTVNGRQRRFTVDGHTAL